MERVAKFELVSREQFEKGCKACGVDGIYEKVLQPVRATNGSAGYDIGVPFDMELKVGESVRIPTGLRCRIQEGWVMLVVPRSSIGVKYRVQLDNTVGVIDSDYYNAENEGHIFIQVTNNGKYAGSVLSLRAGEKIAQALFIPFGITEDDEVTVQRTGGFGSTGL